MKIAWMLAGRGDAREDALRPFLIDRLPGLMRQLAPSISQLAVTIHEPGVSAVILIQRLDGTTREHFSKNWYRHAGLDPRRAASGRSGVARDHIEEDGPTARYAQNRVIEAITPTEWVVHGYSQLHAPWVVPELPDSPYERFRGEDPFDRWPPRLFQGREYRLV